MGSPLYLLVSLPGKTSNSIHAGVEQGYLSATIGEKKKRQTDTRVVFGVIEYKYIITM